MRWAGYTIVMVLAVTGLGCATTVGSLHDDPGDNGEKPDQDIALKQQLDELAAEAEAWIQLVALDIPDNQDSLAVVSFPDAKQPLSLRTYLYDQALALLWFSFSGDESSARALAQTLVHLQQGDGSWSFSFQPQNGVVDDEEYVRTGAVAWAGWALAYHAATMDNEEAKQAAARARSFVKDNRVDAPDSTIDGLYTAGRGYHDPEIGERTPNVPVQFVSTEHQFDVHMLLRAFDDTEATALEQRVMEMLWMNDQNRFAMGTDARRLDQTRALDAAGSWGALWLLSIDRPQTAHRSLQYTLESFPADDAEITGGFMPYLDEVDGMKPNHELIFVEGSLGVALAALRLDNPPVAHQVLEMVIQLTDGTDGGVPYANLTTGDFTEDAAAAPTLWFLMLHREMTTGQQAPLFPVPS